MNFSVKEKLTEEEIEKGLKNIIKDGLATQAMITLTGGVFLVSFALMLGASNTIIGLLVALPPLSQLIQIPAVYLVEKLRVRKAICVYASAISRSFWLIVILTPLLKKEFAIALLIIALLSHTIFSAISNCSWNSWLHDLLPKRKLGDFFSRRMSYSMILAMSLSMSAGFFIDYVKSNMPWLALYSYSIVFLIGYIAGMIGIYFISNIPEPKMCSTKTDFKSLLREPFKDKNFKNLLAFSGSWAFAVNLASPFFAVYMLKMLGLSLSFVVVFVILSQITSLIFLRVWGKIADSYSNKSVLSVSSPLFLICILAWTFTTMPEKHILSIPLLIIIHILMGISLAGVNLASRNIALKLSPKAKATSYLAAHSIINSISAGIAPIIGGNLADFFANRELDWKIVYSSPNRIVDIPMLSFQQWDFFFFFAFLIGLYSIHRLAMVKEGKEVEKKVVINKLFAEVKRPVRNFATAGGIYVFQYPFKNLKIRKSKG